MKQFKQTLKRFGRRLWRKFPILRKKIGDHRLREDGPLRKRAAAFFRPYLVAEYLHQQQSAGLTTKQAQLFADLKSTHVAVVGRLAELADAFPESPGMQYIKKNRSLQTRPGMRARGRNDEEIRRNWENDRRGVIVETKHMRYIDLKNRRHLASKWDWTRAWFKYVFTGPAKQERDNII